MRVHESVCADGAVPPTDGKTGSTLHVNTAPVTAVNETASVELGADSAAAHIASKSDDAAPQSARSSTESSH